MGKRKRLREKKRVELLSVKVVVLNLKCSNLVFISDHWGSLKWFLAGLSMRMHTRTRTHCTHRFFERRLRERLRDAMKLGYAYADAYAIL